MNRNIEDRLQHDLNILKNETDAFPWNDKACYANWLAQTFYYVNHSTRLLSLAAAHCPQTTEMHYHFLKHTAEEKGHEKLLKNDVKNLNVDISDIPEFSSTSALYQTQYYWIEHHTSASFLGYILALESIADVLGAPITKKIEESFPRSSTSFIRAHVDLDADHSKMVLAKINQLPPEMLEHVYKNMDDTFERYAAILRDCKALAKTAKHAA